VRIEAERNRVCVFMFSHRQIKETIVTAVGLQGQTFAVVLLQDGGYGIARNGEPHADHYWPPTQLDDCIAAFLRISGLNANVER
jgi:hypothetical protein